MRKLLDRKIVEQNRQCTICQVVFTHYNDIVPYADIGIGHGMPTFRICRLDRLSPADANAS
jgi:hypothetical protein